MAADRQHLHHRLLNIGHSYRQSVLIMYLWAALFSVTVVSLSIVRSPSVVFFAATLVAVLALLPATMPRLRPWRSARNSAAGNRAAAPAVAARGAQIPAGTVPASPPSGAAVNGAAPFRDPAPFPGDARAASASAVPADPLPRSGRLPGADPFPGPGSFASQDPFSAPPAPNGHGQAFPGPAPFPAAAGEPGEEPAGGADQFPRAQRPDARPR